MSFVKRTIKIHTFDLLAAMLFLGKKVTAEDVAHHFYSENWADADKYEILKAVNEAFKCELAKFPEDHYGLRNEGLLYWLDYKV